MGVGKTTVGTLLALELGVPFFDSDGVLAKQTGEDGAAIAGRDGVAALHDLELELFLELAQSPRPSVIAAAASVVDYEAGRRTLAENTTVWLTAPGSVLTGRLAGDDHRRETSAEERLALHHRREPLLRDVSSFEVATASKSPDEVVAELVTILSHAGLD